MSETKDVKRSDGSTGIAQDSKPSLQNLSDGKEAESILLALLWSPLATLMNRDKALLATANYQGQPATVIILVGTVPTDKGLEVVGTANRPTKEPTE